MGGYGARTTARIGSSSGLHPSRSSLHARPEQTERAAASAILGVIPICPVLVAACRARRVLSGEWEPSPPRVLTRHPPRDCERHRRDATSRGAACMSDQSPEGACGRRVEVTPLRTRRARAGARPRAPRCRAHVRSRQTTREHRPIPKCRHSPGARTRARPRARRPTRPAYRQSSAAAHMHAAAPGHRRSARRTSTPDRTPAPVVALHRQSSR